MCLTSESIHLTMEVTLRRLSDICWIVGACMLASVTASRPHVGLAIMFCVGWILIVWPRQKTDTIKKTIITRDCLLQARKHRYKIYLHGKELSDIQINLMISMGYEFEGYVRLGYIELM